MDTELRQELEEITGKIKTINKLDEQGCTSQVQKIVTDNACYLLKSSFDERYREWLNTEAQVLKKLNHLNRISVPKFYSFIQAKDSSHLLMSFEEGITLTSALSKAKNNIERNALIRSFGRFLQQFHEMELVETLKHHNDWLELQLLKAEKYLKLGQADGSAYLLEKLKSNKPTPVMQTNIHGDCTTDNVLVVDGKVQTFIDVAGMTIGDPRYDESLAISRFLENEEYVEAFYEGYTRYRVSKEEFTYFDEGLYEFF